MPPKVKYTEGERVLCFQGPLIYEAKCLKVETVEKETKYLVHYQGWNKNWDEWVSNSRILKYNDSNLQKQKNVLQKHELQMKLKKANKKKPESRKDLVKKSGGRKYKKKPPSTDITDTCIAAEVERTIKPVLKTSSILPGAIKGKSEGRKGRKRKNQEPAQPSSEVNDSNASENDQTIASFERLIAMDTCIAVEDEGTMEPSVRTSSIPEGCKRKNQKPAQLSSEVNDSNASENDQIIASFEKLMEGPIPSSFTEAMDTCAVADYEGTTESPVRTSSILPNANKDKSEGRKRKNQEPVQLATEVKDTNTSENDQIITSFEKLMEGPIPSSFTEAMDTCAVADYEGTTESPVRTSSILPNANKDKSEGRKRKNQEPVQLATEVKDTNTSENDQIITSFEKTMESCVSSSYTEAKEDPVPSSVDVKVADTIVLPRERTDEVINTNHDIAGKFLEDPARSPLPVVETEDTLVVPTHLNARVKFLEDPVPSSSIAVACSSNSDQVSAGSSTVESSECKKSIEVPVRISWNNIEVSIKIPSELKLLLIDDWYLVTRQNMLLKIPANTTVEDVLNEYTEWKINSNDVSALKSFVDGVKLYFDELLASQLLYKFEWPQYEDVLKPTCLTAVYGSVHLLRLFVKIGPLLTKAELDEHCKNVLVTQMHEFLSFLVRHKGKFFSENNYVTASTEYLRRVP